MARIRRDPRTKEEVLNRMLSFDFDGDIRHLGTEPASITRTGPHTLRLTFPSSGTTFDLSIHRPREFAKPRAKIEPVASVAPPKRGRGRAVQKPDEGRRMQA